LAGTGKDVCAGGQQKANNLLQQHNIVLIVGIVEDYSNGLSLLASLSLMKKLQRLSPRKLIIQQKVHSIIYTSMSDLGETITTIVQQE
jgi:hypothetical protein